MGPDVIFSNDVKGIIFDMDGVIFDSESVWRDVTYELNPQFNITFDEKYRQSLCGMDEKDIRIRMKRDFPHANIDMYREKLVDEVKRRLISAIPLKSGFLELVNYCKSEKMKIGLATSSYPDRARLMFTSNGLNPDDIFDTTIFGTDVSKSKPDPEIFNLASLKLGLKPESCWVVEDSPNGLKAALQGGFKPIMMVDLIEPEEWILESRIPIIHSFEDLLKCQRFKNNFKSYNLIGRGLSYSTFINYTNPIFSITTRLDVTKLYRWCKNNHRSFFIDFLFMVSETSNEIDNFKLRLIDDMPVLFDKIDPSYVVIRNDDTICTSNTEFIHDHETFFDNVRKDIDNKKITNIDSDFNNNRIDLLYISCTPWIDFVTINNPYNFNDSSRSSIPRVTWGKVMDNEFCSEVSVDVSAHHALMDGYHISLFFNKLQGKLDEFKGV